MIEFMGELRGLARAEAQAARRRVARSARPRAVGEEQGPGPVEGHAAEGAVRDRADPRARARDPRRAVERPRSDQRRGAARGRRRDPRGRAAPCCSRRTRWSRPRRSCDAVCIIARGKKVLDGRLQRHQARVGGRGPDRARRSPTTRRGRRREAAARRRGARRRAPAAARRRASPTARSCSPTGVDAAAAARGAASSADVGAAPVRGRRADAAPDLRREGRAPTAAVAERRPEEAS